ncbi:receptor-like protein kinase HERK 1 isoform X1 [Coffea arabica]|uniref:Receptor-like protein kinase HERK 1 isoform X1 n=2 Tax=Coffea arabica TaxID=13443 RepID=A0ABM4WE71_COFAR
MMRISTYQFLIRVLLPFCLVLTSLEFDPEDKYLIDCGSLDDTSVGDRVFLADSLNSSTLSTPEKIFLNASSNSIPSTYGRALYRTARIYNGTSRYSFTMKKTGRHWIRLYFFPFVNQYLNLSTSKFSVSAQNFTLLKDFQPSGAPTVKEYSLNLTDNILVLTFTPSTNSFAFLNALEVISLPNELIPSGAKTVDSNGENRNLERQALETVARINMGNETVPPQNDTLWRLWTSDSTYLASSALVVFVSNIGFVNYSSGRVSENIGPFSVYGTATKLNTASDERYMINATWLFHVDHGFDYFVRFHFCNILNPVPDNLYFNVFLNYDFAAKDLNLSTSGVPHYMDVVTRADSVDQLSVSIGTSSVQNALPNGILNGLEIMKISNSKDSLDASDAESQFKATTSKSKVWVYVGSALGLSVIVIVLVLVFALLCRGRRRKHMVHSTLDQYAMTGVSTEEKEHSIESSIISQSKRGYRFPFAAVQVATDNFSESQLIGVGGFGKVYKGALSDGTKVAVKRGFPQSRQGVAEFKTEIEMLSQFRHRHLVSLIGYCDERNEMIIIYEYMENGTLKDHLYGSDQPKLNWRHRLQICIGSARGLHYLHTGSNKAIIHRDVKSANILLDENLMAKVADFGISKTGPEFDQTHVSTAVKGSFGYLDPEYLTTQQLTDKSDVYSFGVVMIEILCGRPVIDPSQPRERVNLVEWAIKCFSIGEMEALVDPHIEGQAKPESLMKFKETALKCLADLGANRPPIGDVLWNLEAALQLQGSDQREGNEQSTNLYSETRVSTAQFSMGSVDGLAGVSMRRVFSQMVRAENAVDQSQKDTNI